MTTEQLFREVMGSVDLMAAAIVRRLRPADDLISQRKAYEEFGRDYIRKRTAPRGTLQPQRTGTAPNSPLKYSRTEILALQEVERRQLEKAKELIQN